MIPIWRIVLQKCLFLTEGSNTVAGTTKTEMIAIKLAHLNTFLIAVTEISRTRKGLNLGFIKLVPEEEIWMEEQLALCGYRFRSEAKCFNKLNLLGANLSSFFF